MIFKNIKKYLLIIVGSLTLILGTIGIFIPILPTTPFLLVCAYCYIRSSKSLYDWLINHKVFGKYVYSYLVHKAIKKSSKIIAITLIWASLSFTIYLLQNIYLAFMLIFIGGAVSIYLLSLKTLPVDYE